MYVVAAAILMLKGLHVTGEMSGLTKMPASEFGIHCFVYKCIWKFVLSGIIREKLRCFAGFKGIYAEIC